MALEIRPPQNSEEWGKYYETRWQVLRAPWKQPRGSEQDNLEAQAYHLIALESTTPLGVGRIHLNTPTEAQVRYMAVIPEAQGKGIGRKILAKLEQHMRHQGVRMIVLNARESAVQFYEPAGYHIIAQIPSLYKIPHWKMRKLLWRGLLLESTQD